MTATPIDPAPTSSRAPTRDLSGLTSSSLEILAGHPTDAELAALAVVVVALRRERPIPHQPMTSTLAGGWRSYWHTVRTPLVPGREAWRSSFRI